MVATYCSVEKVVTQLGLVDPDNPKKRPDTATWDYLPTADEITDFIEDAEDEIDRQTNSSWKITTKTNEYHSFPTWSFYKYIWRQNGYPIQLRNRYILTLTKFEVWTGNEWIDLVATGTLGVGQLDGDYWIDNELGILWLNSTFPRYGEQTIRVTYTYGQTSVVPKTIRRACILLASAYLAESNFDFTKITSINDNSMSYQQKSEAWEKRATRLIELEYVFVPFPQR